MKRRDFFKAAGVAAAAAIAPVLAEKPPITPAEASSIHNVVDDVTGWPIYPAVWHREVLRTEGGEEDRQFVLRTRVIWQKDGIRYSDRCQESWIVPKGQDRRRYLQQALLRLGDNAGRVQLSRQLTPFSIKEA